MDTARANLAAANLRLSIFMARVDVIAEVATDAAHASAGIVFKDAGATALVAEGQRLYNLSNECMLRVATRE